MNSSLLLDPSVLLFVLGLFAGLVRSNLEIPSAMARFLSLHLLMALGLKGGFSLAESGFNPAILRSGVCRGPRITDSVDELCVLKTRH